MDFEQSGNEETVMRVIGISKVIRLMNDFIIKHITFDDLRLFFALVTNLREYT